MLPRWKAETDGPSVFMSFHLGDIRLCHSSWPSQSRRRTSPRLMARDGCPRDGCSRDGGSPRRMPLRRMSPRRMSPRRMWPRRMSPRRSPLRRMSPRRMAPRRMSPRRRKSETEETDVPETEGVLLLFFCNIVENLSGSYCLIMFEWCVWVQRCLCLVDDSSGVCGCVCLGACGGAYGRKSMFCRVI